MGWSQLPEGTEKITREQFIEVVSEVKTHISLARYRLENIYDDDPDEHDPDALDDVEQRLHHEVTLKLRELEARIKMPAMVKIATDVADAEAEEAKQTGSDIPEDEISWSHPVDRALEYKSPLNRWLNQNSNTEGVRLAFAILEYIGYEESTVDILSLLSGDRKLARGYGSGSSLSGREWPVHACPRCEGDGSLTRSRYSNDVCKRCKGWGYLLQEEAPSDEEENLSRAGRLARNAGEPWTVEDEVKENDYESVSDAIEDGWSQPEGIWDQPAGTSQHIST